jgi:NAD(P)-dependent dehydrogenase (short-subunit alcohol dehydrogenase family)
MKQADLFNVQGHVAFITGAASGLGLAFAEVDVGDTDAVRAAIDNTAARHGRLDAVFANAGISSGPGWELSPSGTIDAMDLALFERAIEINLKAAFLTIRFAATHMKRQKRGSIIATTSIAGLRSEGLVGYGYVAAKAALGNVVRHAAVELAPHNVRVNAIAPGPFLTNIAGGRLHREPETARRFAAHVPMGRMAQPDEIKGLALLLASPAGSFITGAIIPIDGGTTAK